jgi:hypothetical protein
MLPSQGSTRPAMALMNVVLPQPDGPTSTTNSPAFTVRLMSRSAVSRLRSRCSL